MYCIQIIQAVLAETVVLMLCYAQLSNKAPVKCWEVFQCPKSQLWLNNKDQWHLMCHLQQPSFIPNRIHSCLFS